MQLRFRGRIAGAIGILVVLCAPASAKDLCISFNGNPYFANVSIPGKNNCKPVYLLTTNTSLPGYLATGAICLSSDGTTVLLSLSDGYFNGPETIQGTWDKSTGLGTANDCVVPSTTFCSVDAVTVTSCRSQSIPDAVLDPSSAVVKSSTGG